MMHEMTKLICLVICFKLIVFATSNDDQSNQKLSLEELLKESIKECLYDEDSSSKFKPFPFVRVHRHAENKTRNNYPYAQRRRNSNSGVPKANANDYRSSSNSSHRKRHHHNLTSISSTNKWDEPVSFIANSYYGDNSFSSRAFENSNTKYRQSISINPNDYKNSNDTPFRRYRRQLPPPSYQYPQHHFRRCMKTHFHDSRVYKPMECLNCNSNSPMQPTIFQDYRSSGNIITNTDRPVKRLDSDVNKDKRKISSKPLSQALPLSDGDAPNTPKENSNSKQRKGKEAILKRNERSLRKIRNTYNIDPEDVSSCTLQCALSLLQVVNPRGFPREMLFRKFLDEYVNDQQERMAYIRSVIFCFRKLDSYSEDDNCEFSRRLITCMGLNLNHKRVYNETDSSEKVSYYS